MDGRWVGWVRGSIVVAVVYVPLYVYVCLCVVGLGGVVRTRYCKRQPARSSMTVLWLNKSTRWPARTRGGSNA
jgi:hypothetical protein